MKTLIPMLGLLAAVCTARAETTFIRQMAKDPSSVYIVCSGPGTQKLGEQILHEIQTHRDWKSSPNKKVAILDPKAASDLMKVHPEARDETFVSVLIRDERPEIGDSLAEALKIDRTQLNGRIGVLRAKIVRPVRKGLSFGITMTCPDIERESKIVDEFLTLGASKAEQLQFDRTYTSDRIVVHTSPGFDSGNWGTAGREIWDRVVKCSLTERAPEEDKDPEYVSAYLIDRSVTQKGLPAPIVELAKSIGTEDNLLIAAQQKGPDDRQVMVLSAPNADLLRRLAAKYRSVDAVPTTGYSEKLLDLRRLGKTLLLLDFNQVNPTPAAFAGRQFAGFLRNNQISVVDRKQDGEVTLQDLASDTDTVHAIRSLGCRYVWLLSFLDAQGGTNYKGDLARKSDVPTDFPGGQRPAKPDRHPSDSDDTRREILRKWREDCDQWDRDYDIWQNRVQVNFEFSVIRTRKCDVKVKLQLVDLSTKDGKAIWENDSAATQSDEKLIRTDMLTAYGALNEPSRPPVPDATDEYPATFISDAALNAADQALNHLLLNAWWHGDPADKPLPPALELVNRKR